MWRGPLRDAIAPVALGLVQRLVGRAQQGVDAGHADRGFGKSDADGDVEAHFVHVQDMCGDLLAQALRNDDRLGEGRFPAAA